VLSVARFRALSKAQTQELLLFLSGLYGFLYRERLPVMHQTGTCAYEGKGTTNAQEAQGNDVNPSVPLVLLVVPSY
jgi:hypothetical protein